jgi:egghead protein (zeste-white 4 protein)
MRALLIASLLALRHWTGARRQVLGDRRSRLLTRRRQFVRPGLVDEATRLSLTAWGLIGVPLVFGAIVGVRSLLWDGGRPAASTLDHALVVLSATWMAPVAVTAVTVVGYILFRRPEPPPERLRILDIPVCFRIVARGDNVPAVQGTVRSIRATMAALPVYPYTIEVVTDVPVPLPAVREIVPLVVPNDYRTPRGSLYKARALQFAVERSTLPDRAWIMHLDEESHITRSVVLGIYRAVVEEHSSESPRIGQGLILYHRNLEEDLIFGLADSIRSGDDLGRFYVQHRLGVTLFGLHGSFILVRNDIEKEIGFDVGPEGSVTEDAFWALEHMALGRRCRWVDGVIVEQAPQRLRDFLKQRRRWFVGLCQVVRHAPVPLRWRLPLAFSIVAWSLAWLGVLYTYVNFITGIDTPDLIWLAGTFAFAVYVTQYLVGLRINMDHRGIRGFWRRARLYVLQVLLVPVFALMEAAGVVYGIVKPESAFHVIRKQRNP